MFPDGQEVMDITTAMAMATVRPRIKIAGGRKFLNHRNA
jgi:hypothetical protein